MKKSLLFVLLFYGLTWSLGANTVPEQSVQNSLSPSFVPLEDALHQKVMDLSLDSVTVEKFKTLKVNTSTSQKFYFPDLDQQLEQATSFLVEEITDDMADVLNVGDNDSDAKAEEEDAKQIIDAARAGGTRIDNFDDLLDATLPAYRIQPIGNLEAIIVINSLRLTADGGKLGVYVGIKIPQKNYDSQGRQKNVTLIFGTENVTFSAEGGIQGVSDIRLLNDVAFELGGSNKKAVVTLYKGLTPEGGTPTGTYIKFGCSGVDEIGIGGKLSFSKEWVIPANEDGIGQPDGDRVELEIAQISVQDWNDLLIEGITMSRFVLTKYQDISIAVADANIDLSDTRNAASFKFPENYDQPEGIPGSLWRGVFIKRIEITLPKPFKRKCDGYGHLDNPAIDEQDDHLGTEFMVGNMPIQASEFDYAWDADVLANHRGPSPQEVLPPYRPAAPALESIAAVEQGCRIKIAAEDLLIDRTGVTGEFSVEGQSPIVSGGLMNKKWSWSLDKITISVLQSNINGFTFNGGIVIPITKKERPFAYSAEGSFINGNNTFIFSMSPAENSNLEFPLFKALNVSLADNSALNVVVTEDEFKPSAVLFGSMSIGKGDNNDDASVPSITFTNIRLSTEAPRVTGGTVGISGGGSKLNNFPIQISSITAIFGEYSFGLKFNLALNLMKPSDGAISVSGDFNIMGKLETNVLGADEWRFDKFEMSGIQVKIDLPMVKGCGTLHLFNDDPVYGKGFSASLHMAILGDKPSGDAPPYVCGATVPNAFQLSMAAIFGNKDGMRYFMIDGYVGGFPVPIPLTPTPLAINGFGGGAFYHMKPTAYQAPSGGNGSPAIPPGTDTSGLVYEPTASTVFGLKFSVGLTTTGGEMAPMEGKLACIVRFGPNLSLQNVMFWGVVEITNPFPELNEFLELADKVEDLTLSESAMQQKDTDEARQAEDKMLGKFGMSLDFEDGFSFHGFAEVFIDVAGGKFVGNGSLDFLVDSNPGPEYSGGRWHLYVGGYSNGEVTVPSFFDPTTEVTLYPVSVVFRYAGIDVVAEAYLLTGNDIPGPPEIPAEAAQFFGLNDTENNRGIMNECADPSKGTGIAFGSSMLATLNAKVEKKILGKKVTIVDINIHGGLGFDISLLKYGGNFTCAGGGNSADQGLNTFRATGNIYAYISVRGKVLFVPLPNIGAGLLLQADIPNPSYFKAKAVLRFIKEWTFKYEIGEECGQPCSVVNP